MNLFKRIIIRIKIKRLNKKQKKIDELINFMDTNLKYYDDNIPEMLKFIDIEKGYEYCEAHTKDCIDGKRR